LAAAAERGSGRRRAAAKKAVEKADFMGRAPGVGHRWKNGFHDTKIRVEIQHHVFLI